MRFLILIGIYSLVLAGCTILPLTSTQEARQEEQLFIKALDQFSAKNRVELLQQVQDDYPDSPWGRRAETIVLYAQELDKRKEQLAAQREEDDRLKQELEGLRQENQQLKEMIEQLKGLLINQENRQQ